MKGGAIGEGIQIGKLGDGNDYVGRPPAITKFIMWGDSSRIQIHVFMEDSNHNLSKFLSNICLQGVYPAHYQFQ